MQLEWFLSRVVGLSSTFGSPKIRKVQYASYFRLYEVLKAGDSKRAMLQSSEANPLGSTHLTERVLTVGTTPGPTQKAMALSRDASGNECIRRE